MTNQLLLFIEIMSAKAEGGQFLQWSLIREVSGSIAVPRTFS